MCSLSNLVGAPRKDELDDETLESYPTSQGPSASKESDVPVKSAVSSPLDSSTSAISRSPSPVRVSIQVNESISSESDVS